MCRAKPRLLFGIASAIRSARKAPCSSGMAGDAAQPGAAITGRLLTFARQVTLRAGPVLPLPLLEGLHEMLAHALGVGIAMRFVAGQDLPALPARQGPARDRANELGHQRA
jgi:hypothetical protein